MQDYPLPSLPYWLSHSVFIHYATHLRSNAGASSQSHESTCSACYDIFLSGTFSLERDLHEKENTKQNIHERLIFSSSRNTLIMIEVVTTIIATWCVDKRRKSGQ